MYERPPSGPQQPWGQPPQPQRNWPWVLLGCGIAALLVLILMVACTASFFGSVLSPSGAGSGGPGTSEGVSEDPDAPDDGDGGTSAEGESQAVGIGEPGTIGNWRITVDSVETSPTYGDGFSLEEAQGEFHLVGLTVENVGQEGDRFSEDDLALVDTDGDRHEATSSLVDESLSYEQVNPGNRVTGTVAFDLPEGSEPTSLEVYGSGVPLEILLD
ncbi:DUF4352 domain-containing protein [Nocardiopsis protaetiae]|uniref:DUF4352 domain-containing protein n=1 Tax=Nocardiopsis protaetiae TaxID=3382270 RepID=UPI00387AB786